MRLGQAGGDLQGDIDGTQEIQLTTAYHVLDGLAFDQFHRDEDGSVMLVHVVNLGDGRMADTRCRAGLEEKTLSPLLISGQICGKDFQRHGPLQLEIVCPINHAHSSLPQHAFDAVLVQGLPDQRV